VTVPSWSSSQTRVAVGVGQVVGSQLNLAPWRRGRPCCRVAVGWVGVETAVGAQPHQHRHAILGEVQGELGGVVAAVEHDQRHGPAGRETLNQRPDLAGGGLVGVVQGMQPTSIHRGGPGVAGNAQLAIHWKASRR
jgi:hypothetical protein